ncbi:hypothetical protein A0J61_10262, partial [Choanephora cucurbitarum]
PLLLSIVQDPAYKGYISVHQDQRQQIKCLAYADDICVFVKDREDFSRLQIHLQAYGAVSNARFNQHKTEAFALDGRVSPTWQSILQEHRISQYYHASSPSAFRYLGFYICYTVAQRQSVESMLLEKIKTQIQVFSSRSLSFRGRASVANTLILSKLWFTLRILNPPKRFFVKVRSLIYSFVWQKKYPLVAFNQLCLPYTSGGVGLLEPSRQHMLFQVKWRVSLFDRRADRLTVAALEHHLSFLSPISGVTLLALFEPTFRSHHTSIRLFHL